MKFINKLICFFGGHRYLSPPNLKRVRVCRYCERVWVGKWRRFQGEMFIAWKRQPSVAIPPFWSEQIKQTLEANKANEN